ncbi:MAG: class I SAM-dependent methyltransferase [Pseudoramibacter sp.]
MIETFRRQTLFAQACVKDCLRPGDSAVDATAGTGEDTLFLARCVGQEGRVYGFDIQEGALEETRENIRKCGIKTPVQLIHDGHQHMNRYPEIAKDSRISAVMFNLGYWPDGGKAVTTQTETTLAALRQSAELIRPGGIVSVIAYAHAEGQDEKQAIDRWTSQLGRQYDTYCFEVKNHDRAPTVYLILKKESRS